eukprot:TRINITY_DN4591_c0_g2_i1.p1 TRINITY_DN4591_c0_g2~~TRINITY_DN4591_c0_g2_i1.p1  ORF type:complete len:252 (-),score=32.65 TRINITY_DN4591_c0_g2_i1:13-768(-)
MSKSRKGKKGGKKKGKNGTKTGQNAGPAKNGLGKQRVSLRGAQGQSLLEDAEDRNSSHYCRHFKQHFIKQKGTTFCGIVSVAIVMNTLGITPSDPKHSNFSEEMMFDLPGTNEALIQSKVLEAGMSLKQCSKFVKALGKDQIAVQCHHITQQFSEDKFRALVKSTFYTNRDGIEKRIICNYLMSSLGHIGYGGHISPLAAYHQQTDSVLLLDVWPTTKACWVTISSMYAAMNTCPSTRCQQKRGLVEITKL